MPQGTTPRGCSTGSIRATGPSQAFTLAHNLAAPADVDAVLRDAREAGADVSAAQQRDWGGFTGYFADPDGVRWEIAFKPT